MAIFGINFTSAAFASHGPIGSFLQSYDALEGWIIGSGDDGTGPPKTRVR